MAKKANSAYDGTLIQIKRTELPLTDTKVNSDAERLKFGEPLFSTEGGFLVIGDGNTNAQDLKVLNPIPRDLAPNELFYTDEINKRINFIDTNKSILYPKMRVFTSLDATGKPVIQGREIKVLADKDWYKVDTVTGRITTEKIDGSDPKTSTTFPRAQRINIVGMTEDTIPYISLCILPTDRGSSDAKTIVKNLQKSFSRITDVESENGSIVVYVSSNAILRDCYLNVYGG